MTDAILKNSVMKNMSNERIQLLVDWIRERALVHYNKDIRKLPAPWCNHEVINSGFYFTNVRRQWDKQTVWLMKNVIQNEYLSRYSIAMNCVAFRMINLGETYIERFGKVPDLANMTVFDIDDIGKLEKAKEENGEFVHPMQSNAYFLSSCRSAAYRSCPTWMIGTNSSILYLVMDNTDIICRAFDADSMEECCNILQEMPGVGKFIAYQVASDFSYSALTNFTDDDYILCGPGTGKGIIQLLGGDPWPSELKDNSFEEVLEVIYQHFASECKKRGIDFDLDKILFFLPEDDRKLSRQSWTNLMCEYQKLVNIIDGNPMRPRWRK